MATLREMLEAWPESPLDKEIDDIDLSSSKWPVLGYQRFYLNFSVELPKPEGDKNNG